MQLFMLQPIFPEIYITISALVLLIAGAFSKGKNTIVSSIAVAVLAVAIYMLATAIPEQKQVLWGMFAVDRFIIFGKILCLLGGMLALVFGRKWLDSEGEGKFEFPVLIMLSLVGMLLMLSSTNFLALYLGLELSSLSLYILAAFARDNLRSSESGLKYFVLGSLASGILLFGISLIYGFSGSIDFEQVGQILYKATAHNREEAMKLTTLPYGLVTGMVLVLVAFCFKVSAAPFHMWTPDVYEGAPTPVTAFFAVAPKISALLLLVRLLHEPFFEISSYWQQIIVFAAVASMLVGAFGALVQTNIKRLLAYSSIGHVGYILVGISTASQKGMFGVALYLALYLFMSMGMFGCVLLMRRKGEFLENISDLAGISKTNPYLAFCMAMFLFSMAGIPPLAGFFGKMYIFLAAVEAKMIVLAVTGLLFSVVSCFYYLKIVKTMYFDAPAQQGIAFDEPAEFGVAFALIICLIVTVLFFVFPAFIMNSADSAVLSLMGLL